ncbi:hypothetical protein RJ857_23535, partial [Pseudomonas aeruginosa]
MMAADSLHVVVHLVVPLGVPIQWLSACRRACSASADPTYRGRSTRKRPRGLFRTRGKQLSASSRSA